jgi:hypothetical protein
MVPVAGVSTTVATDEGVTLTATVPVIPSAAAVIVTAALVPPST